MMKYLLIIRRYVEKEELVKLALGELQPSSVQVLIYYCVSLRSLLIVYRSQMSLWPGHLVPSGRWPLSTR